MVKQSISSFILIIYNSNLKMKRDFKFVEIGKISGTHNLNGHVTLIHNLKNENSLKKIKHLFIEVNNQSYIPFFVENVKSVHKEVVVFKLDEVDTIEDAKKISGKKVYLDENQMKDFNPEDKLLSFEGFGVEDVNLGYIGRIESLMEMPSQVLATIIYQDKEVLVPLVEATILNIDVHKKIIKLNLPDGILDIN